jgi:hypothetical protein
MGHFATLRVALVRWTGTASSCEMRSKIRADRIRMKQEQEDDAKEVLGGHASLYGGSSTVVVVGCVVLYMAVDAIFRYAK